MKISSILLSIYQQLKKNSYYFLYPSSCLNCQQLLPTHLEIFCERCSQLLLLIDPEDCCSFCFNILASYEIKICQKCYEKRPLYQQMGAAFDYEGPAASLVQELKYQHNLSLAKGMAAFLVAQSQRLNWPLPDALIPVPSSWIRELDRGYNQAQVIAEEISLYIQRPVWKVLGKKIGGYRQASLAFSHRKQLSSDRFYLAESQKIEDKTLWIIDDVMTTGKTFACCAEVLQEAGPAALYALAFCRTLRI